MKTRTMSEICSRVTIKAPVDFEQANSRLVRLSISSDEFLNCLRVLRSIDMDLTFLEFITNLRAHTLLLKRLVKIGDKKRRPRTG